MPYQTDERLKSYLDTNQLHREQMCRAVLAIDKRFTDVRPRHPRGGRDGGRDIEATYRGEQKAYGAVGFVNQANDSDEQKKTIKVKFAQDLKSAIDTTPKPEAFIFLTNINLTVGEKESLTNEAKKAGILYCEIFDRERLRIALDSPDGFSIRFQYLAISLSEEEQASFFAKWGDDIQSVISTGFQRIEKTLNRVLFLQEASDVMSSIAVVFELDRKYPADEIGHFRAFCSMFLKEPKHNIFQIMFGSSDKSGRMRNDIASTTPDDEPGIKHGIGGGQWEHHIDRGSEEENEDERFVQVGFSSSIGMEEVEFIPIQYSHDSFIRFNPRLKLRDIDQASFIFMLNSSLAEKLQGLHIYSNGYKLQERSRAELSIDKTPFEPKVPVKFTDLELLDPWVRIRPGKVASAFRFSFSDQTPTRLFDSKETKNSLERKVAKRKSDV